jgi:NADPH-dependent 2,4-dienoyl-CoA reductase/sulfur reductase-like enzyme
MVDSRSVVVVGAGLGGIKVAEELRRLGFEGELALVGDEGQPPYDRPPLSKEILKGTKANPPVLLDDAKLAALGLTFRADTPARRLDPIRQLIELADGTELRYDVAVIATGARARQWGMGADASNVWTLRTSGDAAAIAGLIQDKGHLAVLGAGFIGCEVAASAREMGCDVTMIEMLATPLAHIIGEDPGAEVARRQVAAGVDLRCETTIENVGVQDGRVVSIELSDGSTVAVDGIVAGLGVVPNTEWLESSGLQVDNGVVCDATGATSHENVYAIGDVARWVNIQNGRHVRVEHWTSTTEHAAIVASQIAEGPHERRRLDEVPYFWSDQYGTKIQCLGEPSASADLTVLMTGAGGDRPLYLYSRAGRLTGVLGFGLARAVMRLRAPISERAPLEQAIEIVHELHPASPVGA